jgi:hypothetical protein
MKKVIILAGLTLMGHNSWGQIRQFQTSRLNATGGAGVASILSTEAAILNPATSAFFDGTSFSYQSYKTSLQNESTQRQAQNEQFPQSNNSQGFFIADHSGPVKGGTAYILQDENNYERNRLVLHGAAPISANTAVGISYNYITDRLPLSSRRRHLVHHQASVGILHIPDEDTSLGLVILDPTRTTPGEERMLAGLQYRIAEKLTVMGDAGVQFTRSFSKSYLWAAGAQINIFSDFFLRAGRFYDNIAKFKGTGWGVGWIGPRLGVEFSQKYSEQFDSGYSFFKDEKVIDSSLSAIIKF